MAGFVLAGLQAGDDSSDRGIREADHFSAGCLSVKHENAGLRKTQPLGEEGPARRVGGPFHGRRGESQGEPLRQLGHQLILRGTRLHVDGEEDVRPVLPDDGWVSPHFGGAGLSGMAASRRS